MVAIIISLVALATAVVALVVSLKKQTMKVVKETKVEHAPVDSPFYYDEGKKTYTLDGNLYANGSISCLNDKKK